MRALGSSGVDCGTAAVVVAVALPAPERDSVAADNSSDIVASSVAVRPLLVAVAERQMVRSGPTSKEVEMYQLVAVRSSVDLFELMVLAQSLE